MQQILLRRAIKTMLIGSGYNVVTGCLVANTNMAVNKYYWLVQILTVTGYISGFVLFLQI